MHADVDAALAHAEEARSEKRFDEVASTLNGLAKTALEDPDGGWTTADKRKLAKALKRNQLFGYARRVYGVLHDADPEDDEVREQYALTTYKDLELPTLRRLDRALDILRQGDDLATCTRAETLGIAGGIYKRKWTVEGKRADLDNARRCYARGYEQKGDPEREYCGINEAFVLDQLAALEEQEAVATPGEADKLRTLADARRRAIAEALSAKPPPPEDEPDWDAATLAEAHLGLGDYDAAAAELAKVAAREPPLWELETTAIQLAALARLRGVDTVDEFTSSGAGDALKALVGDDVAALRRAYLGKVGVALSGGGFRASLFHIGVLAKLAEHDLLRRVEVLSCVSGGSILGAFYYLELKRLLERKPDAEIATKDYVELVDKVARSFMKGVRKDLRSRLTTNLKDNWQMLAMRRYSRTNRVAELLDELFYDRIPKKDGNHPWRLQDLIVEPEGRKGFSPIYENWRREAKVPILVINATTLNTGHSWQFTGSFMGEPPPSGEIQLDANPIFRRSYHTERKTHRNPDLSFAVAASAAVPGLFSPLTLDGLYDGTTIGLVDGGVHDNQGIASLLEQDCTVVLVSDASGQMDTTGKPARNAVKVLFRTNSVLMARVRGTQFGHLAGRRRSGTLRRLMILHLKRGLPIDVRTEHGRAEPSDLSYDAIGGVDESRVGAYGIDEQVQARLAALRTDLDAFTNAEAYGLMAAGYKMAAFEIRDGFKDFPLPPEGPIAPPNGWCFANALEQIASPAAASRLEAGSRLFLRPWHAWRAARRAKEPGRLRRLAATTHLDDTPGVAKWAGGKALDGGKAVIAVPAAAAGAVASAAVRLIPRRFRPL